MGKIIKLGEVRKHFPKHKATLVGGVFDLFHVGHLRYLKACAKYGRPLVVVVQTDRMVSYRKGLNRPIIGQKRRAEIVSHLNFIDYVLILDKPTHYERYLKKIQPKTLIFSKENMKYRLNRKAIIKEQFPHIHMLFLPKNVRRSSTTLIEAKIKREPDFSKVKDKIKRELYMLAAKNSSEIGKISALMTYKGKIVASSGNIDEKEIHAEVQVINETRKKKLPLDKCTLYILIPPCIMCAQVILKSKIPHVYYLHPYGNDDGMALLRRHKITVSKYAPRKP